MEGPRPSQDDHLVLPKKKFHVSFIGLAFAILASFSGSVMALFVKLTISMPSYEVVWFRSVVVGVFLLPYVIYHRITLFSNPKWSYKFLLARSALGAAGVLLKYYSFKNLSVSDATVLSFTTPIFAALFGYILLKESLHWMDGLAAMFSLGGVILTARPSFIFGSTTGQDIGEVWMPVCASLAGAIVAALAFIFVRKLGKFEVIVIVLYLNAAMFTTSTIGGLMDGKWSLPMCETNENWYLLLLGIAAIFLQVFMTKALALEKAVIVTLVRTSDILFAFIWQMSFFSVKPSWYSIGGGILVFMCNVIIFSKKYRQSSFASSNKSVKTK
ncbi:predicted protein [Nematostella vectensis]|uniref:EamA domain-containing protein n=1 Tax=Nematostella vectensis TaxID=45351 RepID=A7RHR9_NEMVE|nr:predicted protein [Nematostella vectensis]|eukprot:XP_001640964.1 predicted protein [Nematostella vectensis]